MFCQAFLLRYFTSGEIKIIAGSLARIAGNFAVKEAVVKAFGTGFGKVSPEEIEVLRDPLGKPYVVLYGQARISAHELGISRFHVSLTDTKELVQAFVVAEGEKE